MNKSLFRRCCNRLFSLLARLCPGSTTVRPWLHRARGVKIGRGVFIGDGVYLDNEYPECIEIQDGVAISIRALVIAHTLGPGKVIIERNAYIGPNVVIACSAGRIIRIGEGAVIGAGCIVSRTVPSRAVLGSPQAKLAAQATVPLPAAASMQEFCAGLKPARRPGTEVVHQGPRVNSAN